MTESRQSLYEKGEESGSTGRIRRFKAIVKSTGTSVYLHEIDATADKLDPDDIFARFRSFARLRDPRVPSLIDAWQDDESIEFVMLEQNGFGLNTDEGRNIIKNMKRDYGFEASFQTLAALATLHQGNVNHRSLKKECYVIHETGLIFLKDTGFLNQLNQMITIQLEGEADFGGLMLVSNLSGFDVADWACMISSILLGKSVLDPSLRMDNEEIQPEKVAMAQKELKNDMGETPFSSFLIKCLQARADNVGGFDNAIEAIRTFPVEEMTA